MNSAVKSTMVTDIVTNEDKTTPKSKIGWILNEISSDKHDAKIQVQFIRQT